MCIKRVISNGEIKQIHLIEWIEFAKVTQYCSFLFTGMRKRISHSKDSTNPAEYMQGISLVL